MWYGVVQKRAHQLHQLKTEDEGTFDVRMSLKLLGSTKRRLKAFTRAGSIFFKQKSSAHRKKNVKTNT